MDDFCLLLEPIVPGLTLPKAFEELEKQFETIANICTLKGSHESQTTGLLLLCHELQRLLRLSFVGKLGFMLLSNVGIALIKFSP